jgi:predicted small lipoprotein YifL
MKYLTFLALVLLITISLAGCGIPDLPGPIGIPGL